MDPITHAISGAALARALPRRALTRPQFWFVVTLTMLPDTDIVLRLFSDTLYLTHHRGITHSLLMLPLWTWLIASLLPRFRQGILAVPWWVIAAAIALHISFDLITSFGTMMLAPLSEWRAALDLVFIIDPLLTLLLLLPLLAAGIWKRQARLLAMGALLSICCYLILCATMHQRALNLVCTAMPKADAVAAIPLPLSPFRWRVLALKTNRWHVADVDFMPRFSGIKVLLPAMLQQQLEASVSAPDHLRWRSWPTMRSALTLRQRSLPAVKMYRWFARFPVLLSDNKSALEFGDLRFAIISTSHMPFRFRLRKQPPYHGWLLMRDGGQSPLDG